MSDDSTNSSATAESESDTDCVVVGIGASAGGLEPIEEFFEAMPDDSGMAFVVIQHLSPDFKSHMMELLARKTNMTLHRVTEDIRATPNSIFLIPPKMDMVIEKGFLRLKECEIQRPLSHPIDVFFRSLAIEKQHEAIAIVLSGTGSDGSLGIREINKLGGLVISQDSDSAKFDGMPASARSTGQVHLTLPASKMPEAVMEYSKGNVRPGDLEGIETESIELEGVDRIFQLLNQLHGVDFSHYKISTVGRRIQRRVNMAGLSEISSYITLLDNDATELNDLYKDLLIGVTTFFRDPDAFDILTKEVVSRLFKGKTHESTIRVWVAGCASGEEAYSIAMLLDEEAERRQVRPDIKIFATDAHHGSLNNAAKGIYPASAIEHLSDKRQNRYFRHHADGVQVVPELRNLIVFARHNLINDAPFTQIDLLTCRNLLIYLQPLAQRKALSTFHFSLKVGGSMLLGPSETPGDLADEFETVNKRWRFYRKRRDVKLPTRMRIPLPSTESNIQPPSVNLSGTAAPRIDHGMVAIYDQLLDRRMPPSILVDQDYEILHIFGGAEKYLQARSGRPSNNLLHSANESLRSLLSGALQHATRKKDIVRYSGSSFQHEGRKQSLTLVVEPIDNPSTGNQNILIEFQNADDVPQNLDASTEVSSDQMERKRVQALESDLQQSQENLQATVEEMETSNEELHATNEELMASNEELQSTNEELHSVNEELYTVNAEYQRRVEELAESNADMDNLLATTRVGVIFLDTDLRIRRFTPEIARLFSLMEHDIGRSVEGFSHNLNCDGLMEQFQQALGSVQEREFFADDRSGTPYLVRAMPYRADGAVAGLVVTLIDIKSLRKAEAEVEKFRFMAESSTDPMLLLDEHSAIEYANPTACKALQYDRDTLQNMKLVDFDHAQTVDHFQSLFASAANGTVPEFESEWRRADGTNLPVEISVSTMKFASRRLLFANVRDITARREAQLDMRLRTQAMESATSGMIISDAKRRDQPITYANPAFLKLTGYEEDDVIGRNCRFLQGEETDPQQVTAIRTALLHAKECRVTIKNYRKDGSPFWNDLHISPVFDEDGVLQNFVGVQHDVTADVEARDLSKSETRRISSIMNATAEGMYGIDQDGYCTFANKACVEMLGYQQEDDLIGQSIHQLVQAKSTDHSGDDTATNPSRLAMELGRGSHVDSEVFWRKDGSSFPVEYRSEPLYEDGVISGAVISFQDISERLAVASQLEQLGAMIDAAHDAIIIWKLDDAVVQWNTGAIRLYGFEPDEAIGKVTHSLLKTNHPDGWQAVKDTLVDRGEWVGILEHHTKSGDTITVSSRHQLLTLSDGERYVLEINRDYSEQASIQEALEEANLAFQQANEAKTQFLANISHELRTPMTAVLGFAEMLKSHSTDSDYRDKVATITRNGKYLLALLNDILDLSKIEAGKMDIKKESVSVPKLVEDVRALMDNRSEREGVPLTFEFLSDVPSFITADRIRVRQILVNLIGNALKFTDQGTVRVQVDVATADERSEAAVPQNAIANAAEDASHFLRIQVIDTGIGMTVEQVEGLFQPFTQADAETSRKFGGTGLGLSISKRLAESMGGSISVESKFRVGSSFILWMPISEAQCVAMGRPELRAAPVDSESKPEAQLPRIEARILLADDRRDVWRVARYFLEKCGATVEVAEDGRQAVDAVNRFAAAGNPFDLILMDMQMPVMTGQEAVAALREQGCELPIIALTADAMEGERESCLAIGCDEYSPKPIDGPKLMRMVKKLINQ